MKIDLTKLRENVVEQFNESLMATQLDIDTAIVRYDDPIGISAQVRKEFQTLITKTHVSARATCACSRCLKEFALNVERDFDVYYPIEDDTRFIDIVDDIREEMLLEYSTKMLCRSDCRGLCAKCGKDLNEGECACRTG